MSAMDRFDEAHLAIAQAEAIVALLGSDRNASADQRSHAAYVVRDRLEHAREQLEQLWEAHQAGQAGEQP
jgi:hypothetical protein